MDAIALVSYDPRWPSLFDEEAARLRAVLNPNLVLAVEHFGSTAVPELSAKPIIDLLVLVRSIDEARREGVPALEALGYSYWHDNPERDRLFFVKGLPPRGPRTHHVHVVAPETRDPRDEAGGTFWERRLAFRDYLRARPDEMRRYEALKRELAALFAHDREAYTDAKTTYIQAVTARALGEQEAPRPPILGEADSPRKSGEASDSRF